MFSLLKFLFWIDILCDQWNQTQAQFWVGGAPWLGESGCCRAVCREVSPPSSCPYTFTKSQWTGQQEGPVGIGACCQPWWPESCPWELQGRNRELTSPKCPVCCGTWVDLHTDTCLKKPGSACIWALLCVSLGHYHTIGISVYRSLKTCYAFEIILAFIHFSISLSE